MTDNVNHPKHYTAHPSGIEAIEVTEHMNFCLGNAIKYCFRSGNKVQSDDTEDLRKAVWYAKRDLESLSRRYEIPSIESWKCQDDKNWQHQEACADKEWLHDYSVFISSKVEISSCHGFRDIRICKTSKHDCLSHNEQQSRQQTKESDLGDSLKEHKKKKESWDRTFGRDEVVIKNNRETSNICKIQRFIREQNSQSNWCLSRSGKPYPFRKELESYIEHEVEDWRKRSVFYLCMEEPLKAIWYLDREIARRKK